jgi:hypothetical protein
MPITAWLTRLVATTVAAPVVPTTVPDVSVCLICNRPVTPFVPTVLRGLRVLPPAVEQVLEVALRLRDRRHEHAVVLRAELIRSLRAILSRPV